jgi:hypothetical protein
MVYTGYGKSWNYYFRNTSGGDKLTIKGWHKVAAVLGTLVIVGGLVFVFLNIGGIIGSVTGEPNQPDGDTDGPNPNPDSDEMKNITGIDWDGQIRFFDELDSVEAVAFHKSSFEDGETPENWNNYADFNISEATSDLYQGEDYLTVSGENTSTLTYEDLPSGQYYIAVVDKSDPANYHAYFADTEMPEQITQEKYDRDEPVDLVDRDAFVRTASYGSDDAQAFDAEGSAVSLSASLDTPSENVSDRERTVQRTIQVDRGMAYLGELDVTSLTEKSDAVSAVEVTVDANGFSNTYELTGEVGDSTTFNEQFREDMKTNPVTVGDQVTVTADITYNAAASGVTADSTQIGADETIMQFEVLDIYGSSVGSSGVTTIEG